MSNIAAEFSFLCPRCTTVQINNASPERVRWHLTPFIFHFGAKIFQKQSITFPYALYIVCLFWCMQHSRFYNLVKSYTGTQNAIIIEAWRMGQILASWSKYKLICTWSYDIPGKCVAIKTALRILKLNTSLSTIDPHHISK